jgi:hypothetical protein
LNVEDTPEEAPETVDNTVENPPKVRFAAA